MRELDSHDTIIAIKECLLGDFDYRYLEELYSPILGIAPLALYRSLYGYKRKGSHEAFFKEKKITKGDFLLSLESLEALGLVRTFVNQKGEKREYSYYLFAPLTPRHFFDSPLHKALLERAIGEENMATLYARYSFPELPKEGEVTTSFRERFAKDLEEMSYTSAPKKVASGRAKLNYEFDNRKFLAALKEEDDRFTVRSLSNEEVAFIASMATMFNYTEETLASFVANNFDFSAPIGKRLQKEFLEDECRKNLRYSYIKKEDRPEDEYIGGNSATQKILRSMQEDSPALFLKKLQKNHKPAESDLRILRHLADETGMTPAAINALVFHILVRKEDILNKNYCEKVGADIVRKSLTNAIDVTDYLENSGKRRKKETTMPVYEEKPQRKSEEAKQAKATEEVEDDEGEEVDFDDIFKKLREREGR